MNPGIFLLLGSNLGDRAANLQTVRTHLSREAGNIISISSIYQTAAWGKTDQPDFFNQVIGIVTPLSPQMLLKTVLDIEQIMGRVRIEKWGTRIIDIDILFYGDTVISEPDLVIPHPGVAHRRFTLEPLAEIAGSFIHPQLNKPIITLLSECRDESTVTRISEA